MQLKFTSGGVHQSSDFAAQYYWVPAGTIGTVLSVHAIGAEDNPNVLVGAKITLRVPEAWVVKPNNKVTTKPTSDVVVNEVDDFMLTTL